MLGMRITLDYDASFAVSLLCVNHTASIHLRATDRRQLSLDNFPGLSEIICSPMYFYLQLSRRLIINR